LERLFDEEVIKQVVDSLLVLLRVGVVFSGGSSHPQNVYKSKGSVCGVADYSDMLFLGDRSFIAQSRENWWIPSYGASSTNQEVSAIAGAFSSALGLLGFVGKQESDKNPELAEKCRSAQRVFFQHLTKEIVKPEIWASLLPLFPIYQREITFALGRIIHHQ